ncbi:MAG: hypothetical protein FJW66_06245, partial [Actinobacteria bacterium]|nr:hypothetical protein [Actinomycetota bacterium]
MEEKDNSRDYKKIYKWDEEKPDASARDTARESGEDERKKSKKVLKREAKEQERLRKKGILKERNKSRLTAKGKAWIIAAVAVVLIGAVLWMVFGYFGWGIDFTRTLAKVDSMKVTEKELAKYIEFLKNQENSTVPPEDDPQYTV